MWPAADALRAVWCPSPPVRGRAQWAIHECEHVSRSVGVNVHERASRSRVAGHARSGGTPEMTRGGGHVACAACERARSARVRAQRGTPGWAGAARPEAASGRGVRAQASRERRRRRAERSGRSEPIGGCRHVGVAISGRRIDVAFLGQLHLLASRQRWPAKHTSAARLPTPARPRQPLPPAQIRSRIRVRWSLVALVRSHSPRTRS